jgi:hypothetical protein
MYVAVVLAAFVAVNADQGNTPTALGLVAAASWLVGWGTGSGWGGVLPWMLVPVALAFGDANQYTGGADPDPVVLLAALSAAISTVLILLAAGARVLYGRRHGGAGEDRPRDAKTLLEAELRRAEERARPVRDRGARAERSLRHPAGPRR